MILAALIWTLTPCMASVLDYNVGKPLYSTNVNNLTTSVLTIFLILLDESVEVIHQDTVLVRHVPGGQRWNKRVDHLLPKERCFSMYDKYSHQDHLCYIICVL